MLESLLHRAVLVDRDAHATSRIFGQGGGGGAPAPAKRNEYRSS